MNDQLKTRPGDQPLPTAGTECVQDALIALIEERKQLGVQRYGSPLMTHNGRDAGRDAVEEALDLTVYSMQVAMELRDLRAALDRVGYVADLVVAGAPWVANRDDLADRIRAAAETRPRTAVQTSVGRHTVDTINDAQLTALYDELDRLRRQLDARQSAPEA